MHFHSLMSVNQHNNNILCIYLQTLIMNLVNNINLYHCSFPMTCVEFDHESKSHNRIDCCIYYRFELIIVEFSYFITMSSTNDAKDISNKFASIVQHLHDPT